LGSPNTVLDFCLIANDVSKRRVASLTERLAVGVRNEPERYFTLPWRACVGKATFGGAPVRLEVDQLGGRENM
jgi:hypothetical protein